MSVLYQWWVLCQRNTRIIIADKLHLALLVFQVPLIALLIIGAFYNFSYDKIGRAHV